MSKLDGKRCNGPPDMIIEILSPSNSSYDKLVKFNAYLQAGVREYWIVDPVDRIVSVHLLRNNSYATSVYGENDTVPVDVLDGCVISLAEMFEQ
jgi:Uma2 family endonuclease